MQKEELIQQIKQKSSFLCVGLDTDLGRIPSHLLSSIDPVFEFNRRIIDATIDHCIAYKPNLAFYESLGGRGLESLEKTIAYIPDEIFVIADAKRGDIGNTSKMYAKAFFKRMNFDALTLSPYMGEDSIKPFLDFEGKWVVLLALTSNKGSSDFQQLQLPDGKMLYESILETSSKWGTDHNTMYVVGATHPASFQSIRKIIPDHFILVPGIGAQGGDLEQVCKYGMNNEVGLIINSSRSILYAGSGLDFANMAEKKAMETKDLMSTILDKYL